MADKPAVLQAAQDHKAELADAERLRRAQEAKAVADREKRFMAAWQKLEWIDRAPNLTIFFLDAGGCGVLTLEVQESRARPWTTRSTLIRENPRSTIGRRVRYPA